LTAAYQIVPTAEFVAQWGAAELNA
jgi:hypothetical protein